MIAVRVDLKRHSIEFKNKHHDIAPREFDVLTVLARYPETAMSRGEILSAIGAADTDLRMVDQMVSRLRKKFGEDVIETVSGVGYRGSARLALAASN